MKMDLVFGRRIATLMFIFLFAVSASAQDDRQIQDLAVRLVKSASIKPGDAVIINGGKHMIPLMEAVAIEVQKAGGFPNMLLNTDKVSRSLYVDVPDKYLEQEPRFFAEWIKHTDVYIGLPTDEDNKAITAGVSEEKFAKASKAGEFFAGLLNSMPVRLVTVNFPSEQDAANTGMEFSAYKAMVMNGVNADYASISDHGTRLSKMLQNAKQIRVTNPAGTDITFAPVSTRQIMVDDGIVTPEEAKLPLFIQRIASLPSGSINFAPLETSANGKVVVPRYECRYAPMNDVSFEFKNGVIQNFKAGTNGSCYEDTIKPYSGNKERFGTINIGLNPGMRVVDEGAAHYRPGSAAGMVWIGVGDNRFIGGDNKDLGGFSFPITNATVTIDGKTVIKDGKLVM